MLYFESNRTEALTISKPMRHMKRSSVEPWIENVGETGCLVSAFKQNTNDEELREFCQSTKVREKTTQGCDTSNLRFCF